MQRKKKKMLNKQPNFIPQGTKKRKLMPRIKAIMKISAAINEIERP